MRSLAGRGRPLDVYRLLGGGVPSASSPIFLFVPNPKTTFVRSLGTEGPLEGPSTSDAIFENPRFVVGVGNPLLAIGVSVDGPGLSVCGIGCAAGRVMKPVSRG
jgi:hypothetical protein